MASYCALSSGSLSASCSASSTQDQALLERGVVLHLAVDHDRAGAVTHRRDDPPGVGDVLDAGGEDLVGDLDLLGVQRSRCRRSRAGRRCGTGPRTPPRRRCRRTGRSRGRSRASRRRRPCGRSCSATGPAGTSRAARRSARRRLVLRRVLAHQVAGVAAADAGRLHPAVGGEVGRAERDALHARAGAADLLDVGHAAGGLEDRVDQDRPGDAGLGLELGEQPVDVVDVLGALHLRDHDHVELLADLGHQRGEVVEHPRAVEVVDPGPQLGRPEVGRPRRSSPGPRARPPCCRP